MIDRAILYLITLCHLALVIFIVVTPFVGSNYMLLMHSVIMPFIMMHWLLNDNTCALTLAEQKIREHITGIPCDKTECFTCKLIDPIYDFKANNIDSTCAIYTISILLWLISIGRLLFKYQSGDISTFSDLFK